jgi:2-methylcitrate dehydratase PrpD
MVALRPAPVLIALVLKNADVYTEERVAAGMKDSEVLAFMEQRISVTVDPRIEAYLESHPSHWPAVELFIRMTDGREITSWTPVPKGEAENPFSWEDLYTKFDRCAERLKEVTARIFDEIEKLETLDAPASLLKLSDGKEAVRYDDCAKAGGICRGHSLQGSALTSD